MKNRLTNFFTFLKKQDEYDISFDKLKALIRPYFQHLAKYDIYEDTLVDCLIPAIYYYDNERLHIHIDTIVYLVHGEFNDRKTEDFHAIEYEVFLEISNKIIKIREDFRFLNYFNASKIDLTELETFTKDVYQFLKEINVWEIKTAEEDPSGYFWQVEWDIEYFQILNIVYHLDDLEEINDVYNLIWILWLMQINAKGVHPNAKLIWENLDKWKEIMGKNLKI